MAEAKTVPNKAYYVTYGLSTDRKNNYSVLYAESYLDARMKVLQVCGHAFAFMYNDFEWEMFPQKQTFAQKFGLTEVPLGPHKVERKE